MQPFKLLSLGSIHIRRLSGSHHVYFWGILAISPTFRSWHHHRYKDIGEGIM